MARSATPTLLLKLRWKERAAACLQCWLPPDSECPPRQLQGCRHIKTCHQQQPSVDANPWAHSLWRQTALHCMECRSRCGLAVPAASERAGLERCPSPTCGCGCRKLASQDTRPSSHKPSVLAAWAPHHHPKSRLLRLASGPLSTRALAAWHAALAVAPWSMPQVTQLHSQSVPHQQRPSALRTNRHGTLCCWLPCRCGVCRRCCWACRCRCSASAGHVEGPRISSAALVKQHKQLNQRALVYCLVAGAWQAAAIAGGPAGGRAAGGGGTLRSIGRHRRAGYDACGMPHGSFPLLLNASD